MERFVIANPSRASLAGIEMPPRGHRVEVKLCYPPKPPSVIHYHKPPYLFMLSKKTLSSKKNIYQV